jgi:hypothetical protein
MFIHIGSMHRNNRVFRLDKFDFEIMYAAGYPSNRHIMVHIAARNMESHKMFRYNGSKNLIKLPIVKLMFVSPPESVVRLYKRTRNDGNKMNITIHTAYG